MYQTSLISKSPEGEPFFKLIVEILRIISKRLPKEYVLPKSFFDPPSTVLRTLLRKGPERKKQKGDSARAVTYIPFSFVKSSECNLMNETAKKTLTSAGSKVSQLIDAVNTQSLMDQVRLIPYIKKLVETCYIISDQLRKDWQNLGKIIAEPDEFAKTFDISIQDVLEDQDSETVNRFRSFKPKMANNSEESMDQADLLQELDMIRRAKEAARKKAAA